MISGENNFKNFESFVQEVNNSKNVYFNNNYYEQGKKNKLQK
jgi:hypothetical protein